MAAANELQKLCETWWERLAHSTKSEQHRFAEHFLELLGWKEPTPIAVQALAPQLSTVSYILRAQSQTTIAAHFTIPGSLDSPSSVVERGLDFCEATRILCDATYALRIRYCFVTDMFRSYLYDARTQELLLHADSPNEFKGEIARALDRVEVDAGALEEARRQPRSFVARQLREWRRRWLDSLTASTRLPEERIELALDRLVVLRYLLDHDILKRPGWRFRARYDEVMEIAAKGDPKGCGRKLIALLHDMWFDWKAGIFEPVPDLDEAFEKDAIAAPLLTEFNQLARTKFALATVLESYNYGDAQEKARVRMIPEDDEERSIKLNRHPADQVDALNIEVDVEDEGYRAIAHWFDRLVQAYGRMETEFACVEQRQGPVRGDLDLLAWSEQDSKRPRAFLERFHFALEEGMSVQYNSPRQYRTARLLLYLHVIARYDQTKMRFTHFPPVERALKPRPRFTDSDRSRIFGRPDGGNRDWDAV